MRGCAAAAAALLPRMSDAHILCVCAACLSSSRHRSHCILQRQQLEELRQRMLCLRLLPPRAPVSCTAAPFTGVSAVLLQPSPICSVIVETFHQLDSIAFNLLFVLVALSRLEQQWPAATRCRSERCLICASSYRRQELTCDLRCVFPAQSVLVLVAITISSCELCLFFSFLFFSLRLPPVGLTRPSPSAGMRHRISGSSAAASGARTRELRVLW